MAWPRLLAAALSLALATALSPSRAASTTHPTPVEAHSVSPNGEFLLVTFGKSDPANRKPEREGRLYDLRCAAANRPLPDCLVFTFVGRRPYSVHWLASGDGLLTREGGLVARLVRREAGQWSSRWFHFRDSSSIELPAVIEPDLVEPISTRAIYRVPDWSSRSAGATGPSGMQSPPTLYLGSRGEVVAVLHEEPQGWLMEDVHGPINDGVRVGLRQPPWHPSLDVAVDGRGGGFVAWDAEADPVLLIRRDGRTLSRPAPQPYLGPWKMLRPTRGGEVLAFYAPDRIHWFVESDRTRGLDAAIAPLASPNSAYLIRAMTASDDLGVAGVHMTDAHGRSRLALLVWQGDRYQVEFISQDPSRPGDEAERVVRTTVTRPDGVKVPAWLFRSGQASERAIIYFHGGPNLNLNQWFGNSVSTLLSLGYDVLYVDYTGSAAYGRDGLDRLAAAPLGEMAVDLKAAATAARSLGYRTVGFYGVSGGGLAGTAGGLTRRDLDFIIVDSPLTEAPRSLLDDCAYMTAWEERFFRLHRTGKTCRSGGLGPMVQVYGPDSPPILALIGEKDAPTPAPATLRWVERARRNGACVSVIVSANGGHGVLAWPARQQAAALDAVQAWTAETAASPGRCRRIDLRL